MIYFNKALLTLFRSNEAVHFWCVLNKAIHFLNIVQTFKVSNIKIVDVQEVKRVWSIHS